MEDLTTLTTFIGWCTVISIGLYLFSAIVLLICREQVKTLHSRMANVPAEKLDEMYFTFLANFKLAFIMLNLVPYVALRLMQG
ncbi:hypothetical protein A3709_03970 [Halioglobus sp. HI00S01]|uniref:DUF6868 family protein n=1 Tax=Halioglobus sp. HI00S01 TaxID=1822214 RepID=UPI0007C3FBA7|nr:hypothetical protein [Halioglobus sp. HI00S01]KZX56940.1 hypothetical protein A3709_03970 [Halioglobus sp. HI00S01]